MSEEFGIVLISSETDECKVARISLADREELFHLSPDLCTGVIGRFAGMFTHNDRTGCGLRFIVPKYRYKC